MSEYFNKLETFNQANSSSKLIRDFESSFDKIAQFYSTLYIGLITNVLSLVAFLALSFYYSYVIGIVLLVLIIIILILNIVISPKFQKKIGEYYDYNEKIIEFENEYIDNHSLISMLNSKKYLLDKFKQKNDEYLIIGKKTIILQELIQLLNDFVIIGIPLFVISFGILLLNNNLITLGAIFSIYSVSNTLSENIKGVAEIIPEYKENKELLKMVNYLYEEDIDNRKILKEDFKNIKFESNGYKIDDKNIILNDLSFDIKKNDFVSLVGNSGCGKSTIFKFILNQINDPNVKVKYNDINVVDYNMNRNIKLVTQTNYLLHDTIKENLCMGNDYTKDEIEEISKICVLDSFISKYGLDKEIDNESNNISGGEKTRICLARILLRKPEVLLLDEICAALDKKTSELIANNIYEYAKKYNITVISISHKDEFFKYSNKIIKVS
jgi:ABC transporter ATM